MSGKQSSQEVEGIDLFCEACAALTINFNDMLADGSSLAVIPRSKIEVALENSAGI